MICANCERRIEAGEEVIVILHALATEEGDSDGPDYKQESVELVYGKHCCDPIAVALYLKQFQPRLAEIFFALVEGIEDLEKAADEHYLCPKCDEPLDGWFMHVEGLYTGVRLICPNCGPIENIGGGYGDW